MQIRECHFGCSAALLLFGWMLIASGAVSAAEPLTFSERVACAKNIEDWRHGHRIWPEHNRSERPARQELISDFEIHERVERTLQREQHLSFTYGRVIDSRQIQAELDRIARTTRMPERLVELFALLDNDPQRIGECLVRPLLVDRHLAWLEREQPNGAGMPSPAASQHDFKTLSMPEVAGQPEAASRDGWRVMGFPEGRYGHSSIWTGNEMIIWGGFSGHHPLNTGSRYDPLTDTWTGISLELAPTPRGDHVATWTGTHMLVWGGSTAQTAQVDSGGRYDPVADQWTPISQDGAPSPRGRAAAVWTGSEWIVWGGYSPPFLLFDDGARYNPHSDTWQSISTDGAPQARYDHRVVWTGGEMIVWGGRIAGSSFLGSGGRYNPTSDTWTETCSEGAPSPRVGHSAVWTGEVMIVWGGRDPGIVNTGAMYRPDTDSWESTDTDNAASVRDWHGAVWTGTEMLVWGGYWPFYPAAGGRFDPVTNTWSEMTALNAPPGRESHSMVWTGEELLVWGGTRGSGGVFATGGRYSPGQDAWQSINDHNAPPPRNSHVSIWTGSEKLIWGGDGSNGSRYDPVLDAWTHMSTIDAPVGRIRASAVWTGTEMIVWGGISGITRNSGGRYNPAADTWQATSLVNAPADRQWHSAVWTGDHMIVWGGSNIEILDDGGLYDPVTDHWQELVGDDPPSERVEHTAVWTGTEMLIWGGRTHLSDRLNSGGRYNPLTQAWTPTSLADVPDGRYHHSAVWTGEELIIWSGNGGGHTGGIYDPVSDSWRATSMDNVPVWRQRGQATVWTGSEMIVWGGWTTAHITVTGGRYDPVTDTWRATSMHGTPGARDGASAVWTGSEMVIWGGQNSAVAVYDPDLPPAAPSLRLLSADPSPSLPGQPVIIMVEVFDESGPAPGDGQMLIWADSGESCLDAGPPSAGEQSAVFACTIEFATVGERLLAAGFSGSSSHDDLDSGDAVWVHRVVSDQQFAVGGHATGLAGSGLELQLNLAEILPLFADGGFQFSSLLDDSASWSISVHQQPFGPNQTCTVAPLAGQIGGADVENVQVSCLTDYYSVGGEVSGLEGTGLILELNNAQPLPIDLDGPFVFPAALVGGSAYLVTIVGSPVGPAQTCTLANAGGYLNGEPVNNVLASCETNLYRVGGMVSGLTGQGLVLDNNDEEQRAIGGNGSFHFPTLHPEGTGYDVSILTQPVEPAQTCSIKQGQGEVGIGHVTSIAVTCLSDEYVVTAEAGAGGSVLPDGAVFVASGQPAEFTLTPDPGFAVMSIEGDCGGDWSGSTYLTAPVEQDCGFEVRFALIGPTALRVQVSPGSSFTDRPLSPALEVHVLDAEGELVSHDHFTEITVHLVEHDSGAQLVGTRTRTVTAGIALFDDLMIAQPGLDYQLQVADENQLLEADYSEFFDVVSDVIFEDGFESE